MRAAVVVFLTCLALTVQALAQPVAPAAVPQASEPGVASGAVSIDRIRRALERDAVLASALAELEREGRPVFRVEIEGELPSFSTFINEGESLLGPAPWGAMTHREFLAMVTPPQARPYGASTNGDLLQLLATSFGSALALNALTSTAKGIPAFIRHAKERAARKEVQQVLAELERRRAAEDAKAKADEAERRKAAAAGLIKPGG
jgi:hypothetical protein